MAKIKWEKYDDSKVGMSIEAQKAYDNKLRSMLMQKKINPDAYISRAGLSIDEQEELGPEKEAASWSPRPKPVHLARYDRTGEGDIDKQKSATLAAAIKLDPKAAAEITAYTNQAMAQSMVGHSFTQGIPADPFGTPVNMLAVGQDRYLAEHGMGSRSSAGTSVRTKRGCGKLAAEGKAALMASENASRPSSRSTMYTIGDVFGTEGTGLRSAYNNLRRFR